MRRRSKIRLTPVRAAVGLTALLVFAAGGAFTAANIVEAPAADETKTPVDAGVFAPAECGALTLTNTITGSVAIAGTAENDLIVGSDQTDTIEALGGDDCIQANGGGDVIEGGLGTDVCLGGPGTDTFLGCETEIQ